MGSESSWSSKYRKSDLSRTHQRVCQPCRWATQAKRHHFKFILNCIVVAFTCLATFELVIRSFVQPTSFQALHQFWCLKYTRNYVQVLLLFDYDSVNSDFPWLYFRKNKNTTISSAHVIITSWRLKPCPVDLSEISENCETLIIYKYSVYSSCKVNFILVLLLVGSFV